MISLSVSVKLNKYMPTGCKGVLRPREGHVRVKNEHKGTEYLILYENGRIRLYCDMYGVRSPLYSVSAS
jgi:hypothetical protein